MLRLEHRNTTPLPAGFAGEDVRFPENLVSFFVERLTGPCDTVFDPFAGFGTTPIVAESLGRQGWGVELERERAALARGRIRAPERIFTADARALAALPIPPVTLAIASPPYSSPGDPLDALTGYQAPNPGYSEYLRGLQEVYRGVAGLLVQGGWVVIEASNVRAPGRVTPLAWDIARAVGEVMPFAGEVVVEWQPTYGYGYDHSYCLLFAAADRPAGL